MHRELYDRLGVARDASPEEIKKGFRKLARLHHPDLNPGDPTAEQRFKQIQQAYDILSDEERRAAYDRFGMAAFTRGAGGAQAPFAGATPSEMINDLIDQLWKKKFTEPAPGEDLRYHLTVTLEEAAFEGIRSISFEREISCASCMATGAATPEGKKTCGACQGLGEVPMQLGPLGLKRPCGKCMGSGYVIVDPCPTCRGQGRQTVTEALKVRIPAGVESGQRLKIRGRGNDGRRGGAVGDLFVVVHVRRHPTFRREGSELMCDVTLPAQQAQSGGELTVPTLTGEVKITLPQGTATGQLFRLKGMGMPRVQGGGKGDLHVRVVVPGPRTSEGILRRVRDRLQGEP